MTLVNGILQYDGLYGDDRGKFTAEYIFLEPIATRSKHFDWKIKPHIHNDLYQIFFVQQGSLDFVDSVGTRRLSSPCLLFIPPRKLHGLYYQPPVNGQILTISRSIIDDTFKTYPEIWQCFDDIRIFHFQTERKLKAIVSKLAEINDELFSDRQARHLMVRAEITRFFIELARLAPAGMENKLDGPTFRHYKRFKLAIETADYTKRIPEYAKELNITPVHLNRVCKSITGKPAIVLVRQHMVQEAQKYLLHTSYSVSEIAYLLKFEYPNYFCRLFRKYTGLSPGEYRRKDRR